MSTTAMGVTGDFDATPDVLSFAKGFRIEGGRIDAANSAEPEARLPSAPDEGILVQARQGRPYVSLDPEAGDLVRGSGGVRKLRWGVAGRGKRGGVRVIYYLRVRRGQVWMLTMYAKNEAATIPGPVLKRIKEEIDGLD